MVLTDQQFARSETVVRQTGYLALIEKLGYADAVRFIVQISLGQGDYLEWQERIFAGMGVDELFDEAQQHWRRKKE